MYDETLPAFATLNRFLEDTCVLVTLAYLLSRGPLTSRLLQADGRRRDRVTLAVVLGLAGASELLFPGDRYPYVPFTLAAAFGGYVGGMTLGLWASLVMIVLALPALLSAAPREPPPLFSASVVAAALLGGATARLWALMPARSEGGGRSALRLLSGAFAAGAVGEAPHALLLALTAGARLRPDGPFFGMCANSFGCLLLALVLRDAYERRQAELARLQAERELAALRLGQLNALQARLHPHFLFNALAAIAGLCVTDPRQAERTVTDLAALLRRFLRVPAEGGVPLREELATVHTYLNIERLRLGDRLRVTEEVPVAALSVPVPRFCLQIPVENAVQHGVAPREGPGQVIILARLRRSHLFLAVLDTGTAVVPASLYDSETPAGGHGAPHGLALLATRLRLAYGRGAGLRLYSAPGRGTVCALRLPRPGRK